MARVLKDSFENNYLPEERTKNLKFFVLSVCKVTILLFYFIFYLFCIP